MSSPLPLGSRYLLLEPLGRGASGRVWRAAGRDGATFAVKVLHEEFTADRAVVARFVHVVKVHDLVVEGRTLAIVMDLVEGSDLRTVLRRDGCLPPATTARLGAQVAAGLAAAHGRGIDAGATVDGVQVGREPQP